MAKTPKIVEISTGELLYQWIKGLREVNKVLKSNPMNPKFKSAEFSFAFEKESVASGKILAVIGIEKSNSKKYSKTDTIKLTPEKLSKPNINISELKLENSILYLDLGSEIVRRAYNLVLPSREFPEYIPEITLEGGFVLKKTLNGLLEAEFFDILGVEGKVGNSKTISHSYKIIFGPESTKKDN